MKLGLNLSFAVKRWLDPVELAKMIKEDFGVDHVQFTWDLIDPWWPQAQRDVMVYQYKDAFADAELQSMQHLVDLHPILTPICWHRQKYKGISLLHFLKEQLI